MRILCAATVLLAFLAVVGSASAAYVSSGTFAGPRGEGAPCPESAPGALCTPGRAAVEQPTGNLFVVDSGNDRIQVFKPNGAGTADFLTQFGNPELAAPWGIAIDENAGQIFVYVADAGNEEIVKYASDEAAVPTFAVDPGFTSPAKGTGAGQVGDFHAALAVDPSTHNLLVADNANKRIARFEADGTPDGSFDGAAGTGSPGAFAGPIDVAVNTIGDVYVIDADGDIANAQGHSQALRYSPFGEYEATLGPVGERERVATVAVNPETDEVLVSGDQDAIYEAGPEPFVPVLQLFNAANSPLPTPKVTAAAQYDTVSGLAFATGPGARLYVVLDLGLFNTEPFGSPLVQAFARTFPPDVTIAPVDPASLTDSEATFAGTVDPNGKQADWHFEYRQAGATEWLQSAGGDAGAGASPVPVSDQVDGLFGNTGYEVRLVAENVDGSSPTAVEYFTTLPGPPVVETSVASPLRATAAVLSGRINPLGKASTYYFEYGTDSGYGARVPLGANAGIGAGSEFAPVSRWVTGLQPATTYHFRLVGRNAFGLTPGPDRTFTTNASDPTPRGFEMVSPPAKNGNDVYRFRGVSSASGGRLTYAVAGSFPDSASSTVNNYLGVRGDDGWQTVAMDPPASPSNSAIQINFPAFAEDLGTAAMTAYTPPRITPEDPETTINLYRRDTLTGATEVLSPAPLSGGFARPNFYGAAADLSRAFWQSDFSYLPQATGPQIYEWSEAGVQIVGVLPGESIAASADTVDTPLGISADGSLAYFNSPTSSGQQPTGPLYVRIDGDSTVEVSAPQRPVAGPDPLDTKPGYFRAASDDGNRVLFTSCEKLTEDSTAVGSSAECNNDAINDLYAYGVDTETLVDLTTADPSGGAVLGVAAISDDASTVYFVARGVLADGASAGAPNLYLLRGGETTFVGTLSEADSAVWALPGNDVYNSRATPDGDHLAFLSSADLTAGADSGNDQVYLYDAGDDSLVCASCDPAGGFEAAASLQPPGASQVGRDYVSLPQPLSDDGQRLFFNTPQPLVPEDGNGKVDVYAYTASGAELLSSGRSSENSYLLQASPSGDDVFITTYERLVGADVDFNADVYDARVGGGFPEPPAPSPPCLGEACQQAPPAAAPAVPGSDGYSGSGNVKWSANARCQSFAQKADRVRSEAKALRQKAAHSPPKQAKRLRKQATQKSGTAQQMQRKAKQCRGGGA